MPSTSAVVGDRVAARRHPPARRPSANAPPSSRRGRGVGHVLAPVGDFDMTTTTTPDASLVELIERLDRLWSESDRLAAIDYTGPGYDAICREFGELERVILVTPAFTEAGASGKRRIVERAELTDFDDLGLISVILALDAERVAASKRA